jgi:hypothetical protein
MQASFPRQDLSMSQVGVERSFASSSTAVEALRQFCVRIRTTIPHRSVPHLSLLAVSLLWFACAREEAAPVVVASPTASLATATPENPDAPVPAKKKRTGVTIDIGDSSWTLLDAKDLGRALRPTSDYADETRETTGRFIQIHYRVVNNGKKQETLIDAPKIVDRRGREFGPLQREVEYIPKGNTVAILETLQPSLPREFMTIIEIASDSVRLQVMFTGLGLMGDHQKVDLDL